MLLKDFETYLKNNFKKYIKENLHLFKYNRIDKLDNSTYILIKACQEKITNKYIMNNYVKKIKFNEVLNNIRFKFYYDYAKSYFEWFENEIVETVKFNRRFNRNRFYTKETIKILKKYYSISGILIEKYRTKDLNLIALELKLQKIKDKIKDKIILRSFKINSYFKELTTRLDTFYNTKLKRIKTIRRIKNKAQYFINKNFIQNQKIDFIMDTIKARVDYICKPNIFKRLFKNVASFLISFFVLK